MCFDSRIDSVLCNPHLKEFTRWSTCFSFLLESSLCTMGLWPVPPEVCFFSPFSTDVWKWGLWTCEVASNTEPESCGRLSVALTRTKFLLPHSLETWRFMIAVVRLSLLWLRYLSQKKKPAKKQKTKTKQKRTHTRLGTSCSCSISRLTVATSFLWWPWGRTHPDNGWHFLTCRHIALMVTVSRGISPACASKCFLFMKLSDSLESHPDDFIRTDCVHTSPITK